MTVHLTVRLGSEPILSVLQYISFDPMLNFDGDGDGDGTYKQTLMPVVFPIQLFCFSGTNAHIVKQLVPLCTTCTDTSIENTVLKRQITGNMYLCVLKVPPQITGNMHYVCLKYLRFRLHLSVISPMAIGQDSHSTWKTWKNKSTPGKPGNIMKF